MVEPLRKSSFGFNNQEVSDGLYIVDQSNAIGLPIPHLPVLSVSNGLYFSDGSQNLGRGDIVYIDSRRNRLRIVLTKQANANTLLLTERCENRCQFCSQPPNELDDIHLYKAAALAILNFNYSDFIGLSGGEPTFNRNAFVELLKQLKNFNSNSKLHILTNGRNFADLDFAKKVINECQSREIVWGIPLYGHSSELHDELVGADGAFALTLQGILHLLSLGQFIELRIVPTQLNVRYLPHILNLLSQCFFPLGIVSIMQLEPKGWARKNYNNLFVPVSDQNPYLVKAVQIAKRHNQDIRLFNYPLCLLDKSLQDIACQSISDWKNYYPEECGDCSMQQKCGGFFTSAKDAFIEKVVPQ